MAHLITKNNVGNTILNIDNQTLAISVQRRVQCNQMLETDVQIATKVAQKVATAVFSLRLMFFKITQTSLNIWATFVPKFVTNKLRNRPIWSHCSLVKSMQWRSNEILKEN